MKDSPLNMKTDEAPEAVAIIGMAGRFPKAKNLEEFWRNLRAGVNCVSFFKDGDAVQWLPIEHKPDVKDPRYVRARAVLEKPEWFDAAFFGMNPQEARIMDPQHRLFLECAWEALEHAGCNPDTYPGMIGVFAGASMNSYLFTNLLTNPNLIADHGVFSTMIANDGDFVPTRVSYKLNLRGPSVNVQTACSTSLVAVCMAAQNLLSYRCDVALAGGVSITFPANRGQFHLEGGILSNDGHCRAFDAKALGTVLGDGVGIVVLKRLSEAIADGDNICAVIKGTAINNDGAVKIGYTAPSIDGQAEAIAMAHSEAGFDPKSVSYIEAHGTGTPLGDPIEIAGLTKAFGLGGEQGQFCAVGSVKSNIGHLDIGAGVAGLIKTVLALQHEEIPPSIHFESPNPKIDFKASPFFVNATLRPWQRNGAPRRAGVSSFGIGGTNSHVALEEAPAPVPTTAAKGSQLLLLSAKTATALDAATDNLAAYLEQNPSANLADVAYTLQVGRKTFAHRRAVVAATVAEATVALKTRNATRCVTGNSEAENAPVAFLFTGQGAQAIDMARGIYETDTEFRANVDRSCELLKPRLGLDLRQILFPSPERAEEATKLLNETRLTQPALFVIEHALALRWMGQGIVPTAMMGHSLGEYVAATLAGVFSLEDALALVAERARLMQAQPAGAMLAVRKPEAEVRGFLDNNLALAAVNAPGLCVVSGPFDDIGALEQRLAASAIASKRLVTSHAFHSPMMEGALRPLADFIRRLKLSAPKIPFVSNLTGTWITDAEARSADYWARHLRNTVRFADGVAELIKGGARVLLEVGPGSTLAGLARQHPAMSGGAATVAASLGRAKDLAADSAALLALGELWLGGAQIDWRTALHGEGRRRIVALPTYPFERKRFVIEPGMSFEIGGVRENATAGSNPSLSVSSAMPEVAEPNNDHGTLAALRALFQELSGVDLTTTSADVSFYELGFDSLFLTQASLAVGRKFGVEITFRQLRDGLQTLAKLAAHIDQSVGSIRKNAAAEPVAAVASALAEKRLPLTAAQREIWYASQLNAAASSAYNEACILQLDGALATDALQRALQQLVARHESLRTTFSPTGDEQIVAPQGRVELPLQDFSATEATRRDGCVRDLIEQELERPFDLVSGPLFRACLVRADAQRHVLTLVVHHTVSDGWSLGVIARELAELYAAETGHRTPKLTPAPSFSDYATRQAEMRQSPAYAAAEKFWREQFADTVPTLELPSDRSRPMRRTFAGSFVTRALAPDLAAIVKQLCMRHECTTFTALLAAFNVLLHRLSGQHDVVVGVPSAAQVMDGMENLVGHCANLLPIRSRLSQTERFTDYLIEIRQQLADAMEHWRYPFGALLQQLNLPRDANRVPLAPVTFNMTRRRDTFAFADLKTEVLGNPKKFVNFDLNFNFALSGEAITLGCYYSTELYDEATILRWFGHFETLLRGIAANASALVDELPILSETERQQILVEWNDTARDYPRASNIPELFQEQVARTPDATALVFGDLRLSYREVEARANQLAHRLRRAGVTRNTLVAVGMERSLELIVALVGILKAGGAYVSLDPGYPAERLAFMFTDTKAPVLLTQEKFRATYAGLVDATASEIIVLDAGWQSLAHESVAALPLSVGPEDLAYVSYTSGSTGKPKGVCIPHRGVVRLVRNTNFAEFSAHDVFLQFAPVAFDASTLEIWGALLNGARLAVFPPGVASLGDIGEVIEQQGVTTLWLTSGLFHQMVEQQVHRLRNVRQLLAGGDVLSVAHVARALEQLPRTKLINGYGPTENTTFTTCHPIVAPVAAERSLPIGRPIANSQIYILDDRQRPVPVGVAGELYAGGDGLAVGYLNRPELTAEKFVANPFATETGARLYRTGDRVRWLADGTVEFLGRRDNQIKLRGFRIELDEVENVLRQQSAVRECLAMVREDEPGDRRLVAYVVSENAPVNGRDLRAALKSRLPDYMIPSAVVVLDRFPLTPNGKVDRRALPRPEQDGQAAAETFTAPRTTTEELLAEIWSDVLGLPRVGVDENFFELGGHSLLATRVLVRVQDAFGIELTMQQFFVAPTVAGSALAIEEALIKEIKTAADEDAVHVAGADLALAKE